MIRQTLIRNPLAATALAQQPRRALHRDAPYLFSMPAEVDAARRAGNSVATPTSRSIPATAATAAKPPPQQSPQRRTFKLYQDAPYLCSLPHEADTLRVAAEGSSAPR